jgi:hypothetical protein
MIWGKTWRDIVASGVGFTQYQMAGTGPTGLPRLDLCIHIVKNPIKSGLCSLTLQKFGAKNIRFRLG